jgi:hypothetical protein
MSDTVTKMTREEVVEALIQGKISIIQSMTAQDQTEYLHSLYSDCVYNRRTSVEVLEQEYLDHFEEEVEIGGEPCSFDEAVGVVEDLMMKHRKLGASDTETREVLAYIIDCAWTGQDFPYDQMDARTWELYCGKEGVEEAAAELTAAAKKAYELYNG